MYNFTRKNLSLIKSVGMGLLNLQPIFKTISSLNIEYPRYGCVLGLQLFFGLSFDDCKKIKPHKDDLGEYLRVNNKYFRVMVSQQRDVLNEAESLVSEGCAIKPKNINNEDFHANYLKIMKELGINEPNKYIAKHTKTIRAFVNNTVAMSRNNSTIIMNDVISKIKKKHRRYGCLLGLQFLFNLTIDEGMKVYPDDISTNSLSVSCQGEKKLLPIETQAQQDILELIKSELYDGYQLCPKNIRKEKFKLDYYKLIQKEGIYFLEDYVPRHVSIISTPKRLKCIKNDSLNFFDEQSLPNNQLIEISKISDSDSTPIQSKSKVINNEYAPMFESIEQSQFENSEKQTEKVKTVIPFSFLDKFFNLFGNGYKFSKLPVEFVTANKKISNFNLQASTYNEYEKYNQTSENDVKKYDIALQKYELAFNALYRIDSRFAAIFVLQVYFPDIEDEAIVNLKPEEQDFGNFFIAKYDKKYNINTIHVRRALNILTERTWGGLTIRNRETAVVFLNRYNGAIESTNINIAYFRANANFIRLASQKELLASLKGQNFLSLLEEKYNYRHVCVLMLRFYFNIPIDYCINFKPHLYEANRVYKVLSYTINFDSKDKIDFLNKMKLHVWRSLSLKHRATTIGFRVAFYHAIQSLGVFDLDNYILRCKQFGFTCYDSSETEHMILEEQDKKENINYKENDKITSRADSTKLCFFEDEKRQIQKEPAVSHSEVGFVKHEDCMNVLKLKLPNGRVLNPLDSLSNKRFKMILKLQVFFGLDYEDASKINVMDCDKGYALRVNEKDLPIILPFQRYFLDEIFELCPNCIQPNSISYEGYKEQYYDNLKKIGILDPDNYTKSTANKVAKILENHVPLDVDYENIISELYTNKQWRYAFILELQMLFDLSFKSCAKVFVQNNEAFTDKNNKLMPKTAMQKKLLDRLKEKLTNVPIQPNSIKYQNFKNNYYKSLQRCGLYNFTDDFLKLSSGYIVEFKGKPVI